MSGEQRGEQQTPNVVPVGIMVRTNLVRQGYSTDEDFARFQISTIKQ
jgi:hypothetical protein